MMAIARIDNHSTAVADDSFTLLGIRIAATDMADAVKTVRQWVADGEPGRMVTFTTVHMVVESLNHPEFASVLARMDRNFPDGMPVVWAGRRAGKARMGRICGPEFMPAFCAASCGDGTRHFFYGGADGVAQRVADELTVRHPGMQVAGVYSPRFGEIPPEEDEQIIQMINRTQPDVIWVCLGCPKQEFWMASHRHRLNAKVLLSVGLAFDIVAGSKKRAPRAMRIAGLEWLYRLCQEPKRLWRRYTVYNTKFIYAYLLRR